MHRTIEEILKATLPQQTDLSDKQRAVLYSALIQFSEKGFERTSTKDIASYAGVAEGTVYKKFKTKEALLFEGLIPMFRQHIFPVALREFKAEVEQITTFEQFIATLIENRSHFIIQNRKMIKVLLNEVATSKMLQQNIQEALYHEVCAQFEPLLRQFQEKGEMQPIPTPQFVQLLMTQIFSLNIGYILDYPVQRESYETLKNYLKMHLYRMFTPQ